jgi:hypothetical protein
MNGNGVRDPAQVFGISDTTAPNELKKGRPACGCNKR